MRDRFQTSEAYRTAIVGDVRRIVPEAVIDLVDPDLVYLGAVGSDAGRFARPDQLFNKTMTYGENYMTLEPGRNLLDGSFQLYPDSAEALTDEQGYMNQTLSDAQGNLSCYGELQVRNLSILQAASICFSDRPEDGVGQDFTFTVYGESGVLYETEITGNDQSRVMLDGFTVENVTALRVTVRKWSLPYRYFRLLEIVPGIYEVWDGDQLQSVDVLHETSFTGVSLPYGTASLAADNADARFHPYEKNSLFRSIEERQGIVLRYQVQTAQGWEAVPVGVFYQTARGWSISRANLLIRFKLVDLIGLVSKRDFTCPSPAPTTAAGWVQACLAVLGENFQDRYVFDGDLGQTALTVADGTKITDCGNVLRYVAQALHAYVYADPQTGKLRFSQPDDSKAGTLTLDNMSSYPEVDANTDLATLKIKTAGGEEYTYEGTVQTAQRDLSLSNPFIQTKAQADALAAYILPFYGGSKITVKSRGDPSAMVGDLDTIETGFGVTLTGRRYQQQLKIQDGILKDCTAEFYETEAE
jgi:hypothetical protein